MVPADSIMEANQGQEAAPPLLRVDETGAGLRADIYLFRELSLVSRTRVRQKVQTGEALLNGHRFSTATRLRAGDEVRIHWRSEPPPAAAPPLTVLYEDAYLLVVDKPAGMAVHPAGGRQSGTLVQAARERCRATIRARLEHGDSSFYPTLVNRLDAPTSGIVLLALTRPVHKALQAMNAARLIDKEYLALVEGLVPEEEGLIDLPIGPSRDSRVRLKMSCRTDGRESRTRFQVIRRFAAHTLLRAFPVTGRQHQLRVHFAATGHPVTGDLLYRDESLFLAALRSGAGAPPPRLCLHALRMTLAHPVTGRPLTVEAAIPEDLAEAMWSATGEEAQVP